MKILSPNLVLNVKLHGKFTKFYIIKTAHMKKPQIPYILPESKYDRNKVIESNNGEGVVPINYRPVEMTFAHLPTEDRQEGYKI